MQDCVRSAVTRAIIMAKCISTVWPGRDFLCMDAIFKRQLRPVDAKPTQAMTNTDNHCVILIWIWNQYLLSTLHFIFLYMGGILSLLLIVSSTMLNFCFCPISDWDTSWTSTLMPASFSESIIKQYSIEKTGRGAIAMFCRGGSL